MAILSRTSALTILLFSTLGFASAVAPSSYAIWAADSAIARGQGNGFVNGVPAVSYEHGELQWALRLLFDITGIETYFDYIKSGVDTILSDDGSTISGYKCVESLGLMSIYSLTKYISASENQLDPIRVGPTLIYL